MSRRRQSEQPTPVIRYLGRAPLLLLAVPPFAVAAIWGMWHFTAVTAALQGHGSPLAFTWAVAFAMLWWVLLAWFEKPFKVTDEQAVALTKLTVTVQVPAYNEDPYALRRCLLSLIEQTRRPTSVRVVDDGSADPDSYAEVKAWFIDATRTAGIHTTWDRTVNRGKRYAQMHVLTDDPADIFITLDSDSVLERTAIDEGLKPFADPTVMSVAGMVAVWNSKANALTMLTCMLYAPFTRAFRSAQSVLGQVMVNSGTLAFYRGWVIRDFAGAYENEQFWGKPMQMNDDSFMTFAAMLQGKTVHQPTSVAFTLAPDKAKHYFNQQLRWMRGTFVRQAWWFRYLSPRRFGWWMPVIELGSFLLSIGIAVAIAVDDDIVIADPVQFWGTTALFGVALNYLVSLRYFIISRSDESLAFQVATFALAPVAGLWRLMFLRGLMLYAMATFWKVSNWGTRSTVEVGAGATVPQQRTETSVRLSDQVTFVIPRPGRHRNVMFDETIPISVARPSSVGIPRQRLAGGAR